MKTSLTCRNVALNVIERLESRIAPAFAPVFNLSGLDGLNGFQVTGAAPSDGAGGSVSDAGDVNGDGLGDFIVGAPEADPNGLGSGASYVVFGKSSGFGVNFNLSTLNGANGFKLSGVTTNDESGRSVSAAGDVNGDGFDDIIVGSVYAPASSSFSGPGAAYVIFGKSSGFAANFNLSSLDGRNGFKLSGVAVNDSTGDSVSGAGDINGDNFDDVIIGAPRADLTGTSTGASYVVFGQASGFAANLNLSALNGTNGFKLTGVAAYDYSGGSVSGAGDINGDGLDDLIIGADGADLNVGGILIADIGASYVVFGKTGGFAANLNLSSLNGTNGFKLSGVVANDGSGDSVSGAGDVNGDGVDDVVVAAYGGYSSGPTLGGVYVVFGNRNGFAANVSLATLNGNNGFKVSGVEVPESSSPEVSGAGDFNGDGFSDVIIGAEAVDANGFQSGASYLIFGEASGFGADLNVSTLNGLNGFKLNGVAASTYSGGSVSLAGDVNGDGFDDLIIGAYGGGVGGVPGSGASYIVFGRATPLPDLALAITSDHPFGAHAGETVTYTLNYTNKGTQDTTGIALLEALPANTTFNAAASTPGWVEASPGIFRFDVTGRLVAGAFGSVNFAVSVPETLPAEFVHVINGASIADNGINGPDPTPLNNVAANVIDILVDPTITGDGTEATFTEPDGDIVTIKLSTGGLSPENIFLTADGRIALIDLTGISQALRGGGPSLGLPSISVVAQTPKNGGGDGFVGLGMLKANGMQLGKVKVKGDLGGIEVGTGEAGTQAIKLLTAGSLSGTSVINGTMGTMKIQRDITGVMRVTGGFNDGPQISNVPVIGKMTVGGNLDGRSGGTEAGLIKLNGGMKSLVIKGDVIGGADVSGIVSNGKLGKIKIVGDLRSDDPSNPVTISALGILGATTDAEAIAIRSLIVTGDVTNAEILAGYNRDGTPANADAGIGKVIVKGNLSASSIAAGIADSTNDGFGRGDTLIAGDTTPSLLARIASVTIKGTATGSTAASDFFGITAQAIAKVKIGGTALELTDDKNTLPIDPVNNDFQLVEV